MKNVAIPQRVDEPPHFLLWSADELVSGFAGLIVGVVCGRVLFFGTAGVLVIMGYRKFRDNNPDGFLLHLLWRAGCLFCNSRSMKNPYSCFYLSK